ncbi:MAG: Do family serine endopeptidase [Alkalispirochaeta sp.]
MKRFLAAIRWFPAAALALTLMLAAAPVSLSAQESSADREMEVVQAYQNTLRRVSQQVLPVVVEVDTVRRVSRQTREMPSPLEFFFGRPDSDNGEPETREFEQRGIGSGILVRREDSQVYVLTNDHVAGSADEVSIRLHDDRQYDATVVGSDPNRDLALLVFETDDDIPIANLGDSDEVQVGDIVLAVGNPLGFESTVTSGMVSAVERQGPNRPGMPILTDYIQTDAAINRGNSGGPLVNLRGEVVGMNTWIASQSGGSIGLGFAIPINNARRAIDQFIAGGRVEYGWLGVNMANPPSSPSDSLGESEGGAFVYSVYQDSPADEGGVQPGDIITRVNSTAIENSDDLLRAVADMEPGTRTRFRVRRDGRMRTLTINLGVRPSANEELSAADLWPGMSVVEATEQIRENLDLSSRGGDLIIGQVASGSPAATAGLKSGDIITRVNSEEVSTLAEFYRALNDAGGDEVVFRIRRNDTNLIIGLVK